MFIHDRPLRHRRQQTAEATLELDRSKILMIDDARKKVLIGTALHQARLARRCRYHAVVAKPELEFRNIRATGIAKVYWAARSGALDDLYIFSYLVRRLTRVVRHAMSVCVKLQIESLPVHRCGLLRTDHVQN